jgi:hypothetical protein
MSKQAKAHPRRRKSRQEQSTVAAVISELSPVGEATVASCDAPPRGGPGKEIHVRRTLPPVPEGTAKSKGD